jgi:GTPase
MTWLVVKHRPRHDLAARGWQMTQSLKLLGILDVSDVVHGVDKLLPALLHSSVGLMWLGTVKRGVISPTTPLLLGPDIGDGSFKAASIKSIHYKRLPVGQVVAGQTAALALKKIKRTQVKEGWCKWFMVLTSLAKSTAIVCSHSWTVYVCLRAVMVVGAVRRH